MIEVGKTEYKRIAQLIEADIEKCLYIYMNLVNYERENSSISVFVDDDKELNVIIVEYHNSFQVYEREVCSQKITEEIVDLIMARSPQMIAGTNSLIEKLKTYLDEYVYKNGGIFLEDKYRTFPDNGMVREAKIEDAMEIARLISSNKGIGSHYEILDLANQIEQRIKKKTGRSYIIKADGRIVAHTATYAQTDKYAVVSGTIIDSRYREKNYYLILSNYMIRKLTEEGIKAYTLAINEKMYKYHKKVHLMVGTYARLTRKGDK